MKQAVLKQRVSRGVYIFAPDKLLTHFTGCLVEGLLDLGIPVKTNAERVTSRPTSMPLPGFDLGTLHSDPVTGFDVYLVDISAQNTFAPLTGIEPAMVGYITTSDISAFCEVPNPYRLFSAHESRHAVKAGKRSPIAFGIANRLLEQMANVPAMPERDGVALHSFRPTLQQGVRALLDLTFIPALERHLPVKHINVPAGPYQTALMNTSVCLAYGGDFYSPIMGNTWFEQNQPDVYKHHSFEHVENAAVLRWDSWRFWESLVAGCVTVHLDFEACGFHLPVMPEPWVHYVPVDLSDLKGSSEALWNARDSWADIAARGRKWAIEHYAPAPTAKRVLKTLLDDTV